jgi:hypothetical protein
MINTAQDGDILTITVNPFSSFKFRVVVDWTRKDLKILLHSDIQGEDHWTLIYRVDNGKS